MRMAIYGKRMFSKIKLPIIECKQGRNIVDLSHLGKEGAEIEALVIVNNVLNLDWLDKGLKACGNVVIADGGANKLYNTPFRENQKIRSIVGDFDSIHNDVRQYFESRGVELEHIQNQSKNDFEKAFTKAINNNWRKILCLGAFGGRMDHSLSGMSNTAKLCRQYKDLEVLLVGRENFMYYCRPGIRHQIRISSDMDQKGCGIIRFGSKVNVKTEGLKWNLGGSNQFSALEWGEFISTSNQIDSEVVSIQSDGELFFTSHFRKHVL